MPNYEVSASLELSEKQRDAIAQLLTTTHSELNGIPTLFINVKFLSTNWTYLGGRRTPTNIIVGHFRQGSSRTQEQYKIMADRIIDGWNSIIGFSPNIDGDDSEKKLDSVLFLSTINAGAEQGYHLPTSGNDVQWFKDNMDSYKQKADSGSWRFKGIVEELQAKGLA